MALGGDARATVSQILTVHGAIEEAKQLLFTALIIFKQSIDRIAILHVLKMHGIPEKLALRSLFCTSKG